MDAMTVCWMLILVLSSCLACRADDDPYQAKEIQKRSLELPDNLLFENELKRVKRLDEPDALVRVKRVEEESGLNRVKRMKRSVPNIPSILESSPKHFGKIHRIKRHQLRQRDHARKMKDEVIRRNVERTVARIRRHDADKLKEKAMKMAHRMHWYLREHVFKHGAYKRKHHVQGRFKRDKGANVPKHSQPIHTQKKNGHQHQYQNGLKHHATTKKAKVHKITKRKDVNKRLKKNVDKTK